MMKRQLCLSLLALFILIGLALPVYAAYEQPAPSASARALAAQMLVQFQQQAAGHQQELADFHFASASQLAQLTLGDPVQVFELPDAAAQHPPAELSAVLESLGWLFPMMTGTTYHGFLYVADLGSNRWRNGGTFNGSLAWALSIGLKQRLPAALAAQRLIAVGPARTFAIGTSWFILMPTDQGTMILPLGDFPPYWVAGRLYPQTTLVRQFPHLLAAENADQSALPGPHALPTSGQGLALIWLLSLLPAAIPVLAFAWFVRRQRRKARLDQADPMDKGIAALWESEHW
jgi:hypothetical protein